MQRKINIFILAIFISFTVSSCDSCESSKRKLVIPKTPNFTLNGFAIKNTDDFTGEPELKNNEIYTIKVGKRVDFEITNIENDDRYNTVYWDLEGNGNIKRSNKAFVESFTYNNQGKFKVSLCFDIDKSNCISKWIHIIKDESSIKNYSTVKYKKPSIVKHNTLDYPPSSVSSKDIIQSSHDRDNIKTINISDNKHYEINSLRSNNNKNKNESIKGNSITNTYRTTSNSVSNVKVKNSTSSSKRYTGMNSSTVLNASTNKCETLNNYTPKSKISVFTNRELKLSEVSFISHKSGRAKLILKGTHSKSKSIDLNLGTNVISLHSFSEILKPGKKYILSIEPIASGFGLADFKIVNKCIRKINDSNISINYITKSNVLFNLKYNY